MNVSGTKEEDGFEAGGRNEDGSEDENSVSAPSMEELYARCPQAAINKRTKPKAVKLAKDANYPSNNAAHISYDPDTCCKYFLYFMFVQSYGLPYIVFTIQCITCRPDSSNAPFEIQSTISLAELRHIVAEKMGRFPSHVRLQYRLPDVDKAKEGFTSIQTEMELVLFKARMRPLIVRGKLSNGRMSNRAPKNPMVVFADASIENPGDNSAHSKTVVIFTCCQAVMSWPNIIISGKQGSSFWIVIKAKADITIRWSDDWDKSARGADQRTPGKMEM